MRALRFKFWLGLLLFLLVAGWLGRDILFDWDHLQIGPNARTARSRLRSASRWPARPTLPSSTSGWRRTA